MREAYAAIDLDVMVFLLGVLLITGFSRGGFRGGHSRRGASGAVVVAVDCFGVFRERHDLSRAHAAGDRGASVAAAPVPTWRSRWRRSAMTPTGNPQNMLIGVASGIPFARFLASLALPSLGGLVIVFVVLRVCTARPGAAAARGDSTPDGPIRPPARDSLAPRVRRRASGWLAGFSLPLVAITAAAILLVIARRDPARAFAKVEWSLLLFFGALFVVMRGARDLPLVASLTSAAGRALTGAPVHDAVVTSAAMLRFRTSCRTSRRSFCGCRSCPRSRRRRSRGS